MSIVTLLKSEEFSELKYFIKAKVPKKNALKSSVSSKPFSKLPMRVDYGGIKPYQARRIGYISDYMFCLSLARFVTKNKVTVYESMNHRAMELYEGCINNNPFTINRNKEMQHFENAIRVTKNYADGKCVAIEDVIQAAYTVHKMEDYLHYVEYFSKEQFFSNLLDPCDKEVVAQVIQLICVFEEKFIESGLVQKNSTVICHPSFEPWSSRCGGGIADIYIDGVLYDFKSTKDIGYHWEDVGQVYAYYLLSCLCDKELCQSNERYLNNQINGLNVDGIAMYFSRYGDIERCDLAQCGALVLDEDLIWLENTIMQHTNAKSEKLMSELNLITARSAQ